MASAPPEGPAAWRFARSSLGPSHTILGPPLSFWLQLQRCKIRNPLIQKKALTNFINYVESGC